MTKTITVFTPSYNRAYCLHKCYESLLEQSNQDFIWLIDESKLIISDSGGIQEEAPSLGKPVLVLRDRTERPEAVNSGTVILVGTKEQEIFEQAISVLNDKNKLNHFANLKNPYGDGKTSERIVKIIRQD